MRWIPQVALVVFGSALAIPVGAYLAFFAIAYGGQLAFGRDFVQVGWIFALFGVPAGALLAAALGGLTILRRPRLYLVTFLPLAIVFLGLTVSYVWLRSIDRPRKFVLEVTGTPGAEYFGIVSANGRVEEMQGTLPARFEYNALRLESTFVLVESSRPAIIMVNATADGHDVTRGLEAEHGVDLYLRSFGYSEFVGGTSHQWGTLTADKAADVHRTRKLPEVVRFF